MGEAGVIPTPVMPADRLVDLHYLKMAGFSSSRALRHLIAMLPEQRVKRGKIFVQICPHHAFIYVLR